jgi:NADP-dependent alcohol dehydrogenase
LQYAERVWEITAGDEQARIDAAIARTREFFKSLQVGTRLCDYNLTEAIIPTIVERLKAHNMTKLGEKRDVTPELAEAILRQCL